MCSHPPILHLPATVRCSQVVCHPELEVPLEIVVDLKGDINGFSTTVICSHPWSSDMAVAGSLHHLE